MSQWFNGAGLLTPTSSAQAATLILEGVVSEHEASSLGVSTRTSITEQPIDKDKINYNSSFPLIRKTATETACHLCFFPSGAHRFIFKCYKLFIHELIAEHGILGFVHTLSRNDPYSYPRVQVFEYGKELAAVRVKGKINSFGIESRDRIALGHDGWVDIYDRQNATYSVTERIKMKRHTPETLKFSGELLLVGTKRGCVSGYNLRAGQFSWTFQAPRKDRIYDLREKKGIVYVFGSRGLWMWDMRGTGRLRRQFLGHRNGGKAMEFDVDAELGLLAAGGWDGKVRLWNCRSGEDPVGDLKFQGEIPLSVKFVRETYDGEETLGLWISTKRRLYTCMVSPNAILE